MPAATLNLNDEIVIEIEAIQQLLDQLRRKKYRTIAPRVRDGAVILGDVDSVADLPAGWTDLQAGGALSSP